MQNSVDNRPRAAILVGDGGVCGIQPLIGIEKESRADASAFLLRLVPAMLALDEAMTPTNPVASK
jgi:hypothetical protein